MTKSEVAAKLAGKIGISNRQSVEAVQVFLDCVKSALREGDRVTLVGFGTFYVRERDARNGRNPRTGSNLSIPKKRVAGFKPGKAMRDEVNALSDGR